MMLISMLTAYGALCAMIGVVAERRSSARARRGRVRFHCSECDRGEWLGPMGIVGEARELAAAHGWKFTIWQIYCPSCARPPLHKASSAEGSNAT